MSRPNFLFILSDQHSPRFLNKTGDRFINTPNLDKMMDDGVRFIHSYCQNPLCVPSRASLLTGKYSRNLGIYENRHVLQSNSMTLPYILGQNGYRTCLVGKSHFNGEQFQGYQQRPYGDLFGQGHQPNYIRTGAKCESEHGLEDLLDNSGSTAIPLPMTQTEIVVSESVKWLQEYVDNGRNQPFFLSVHFDKPHFPYRAPKALFEKYLGKVSVPENNDYMNKKAVEFVRKAVEINGGWEHYGKDKDIQNRALAAYCACVEWIDDAIGRIIESLDFLGLGEDTIVIYSADHGEMAGEKGAWQKTVFFDDSARIPLILRWKNHLEPDVSHDDIVGLIDMFPTMCDYAGIPIPSFCDGVSLRGLIEDGAPLARDYIFSESVVLKVPEHAGCMLRKGDFKYNYYIKGKHELYDLMNDVREERNLIDDVKYASITQSMKNQIEQFWEPEKQIERYEKCPTMLNEKHFYFYSNQFLNGDGAVFNGRP